MDFAQCGVDVLRDALARDAWFRGCPDALQDALLAHSRPRQFAAGEAVYRQGEPPRHAVLMAGGQWTGGRHWTVASSTAVFVSTSNQLSSATRADESASRNMSYGSGVALRLSTRTPSCGTDQTNSLNREA